MLEKFKKIITDHFQNIIVYNGVFNKGSIYFYLITDKLLGYATLSNNIISFNVVDEINAEQLSNVLIENLSQYNYEVYLSKIPWYKSIIPTSKIIIFDKNNDNSIIFTIFVYKKKIDLICLKIF